MCPLLLDSELPDHRGMEKARQPGDVFLNRYMPNATEAEREVARQNLYAFFAELDKIATRRALEDFEKGIRADPRAAVKSEDGQQPSL